LQVTFRASVSKSDQYQSISDEFGPKLTSY
jgi:hypothetical protein